MEFVTDLCLPRTADTTSIPASWAQDHATSHQARGALAVLASFLTPDMVVPASTVEATAHVSDPSLGEIVADLVEAGYLVDEGNDRYRLVHPDRLGPLPEIDERDAPKPIASTPKHGEGGSR